MLGDIMKLSRLRMWSDGNGISTLVVFWGCPLHCKYCANSACHEEDTPKKSYNPQELVNKLKQDDIYYKMTGGGIVFGGGEPLMQAEFIKEVCNLADPMWEKRIETSLYIDWEKIKLLIDVIDEWIIDIKDLNLKIYLDYTGRDNDIVIQNLIKLIANVPKEKILIRVPYISGFNSSDDVERSVEQLETMRFSRIERFEYKLQ
ncbi:MAG: radical SAM protein [Selenomonadaceae bacterium]|nr:radical SAM protein [Selenomonadaceae bacterium]